MNAVATSQPERSALATVLYGAPVAESVGADFKRGTWTFKVGPLHQVSAGRYILVPAIVAQLALDQESAESSVDVQMLPVRNARVSFRPTQDGVALTIENGDGYECDCYRDYQPNDRTKSYWEPAHWRVHVQRVDVSGHRWRTMFTCVQDDFGNLVEVAA